MSKIQYTGEEGCLIEGHWGQYAGARLIAEIAAYYGWDDHRAIRIANKHLATMGPNTHNNPYPTEAEYEYLFGADEEATDWLNENVAEKDHQFGWHDGEFFYMPNEWWEETDYC